MKYGLYEKESKGLLKLLKNGKVIRERYFDKRAKRKKLQLEWLKLVNYKDRFDFLILLNETNDTEPINLKLLKKG